MALVIKDRVKETTTTTGTGTYTLAGAEVGFQSFSTIGNGNTTYYTVTDNVDWEVGIGTYTASGTTLARTTILSSSNSNNAVSWSAGEKFVFVTQPSSKASFLDASGDLNLSGDISVSGTVDGRNVSTDGTKIDYITVTQAVNLDEMETDIAALANGMVYKGDWDASSGSFPSGAQTGWFYYVSVAGTVDSVSFNVGDNLVATTDGASTSTYASNWSKHDQTDAVQAVVGLTGSISKSGLLSALNVEDGADVTDATNVTAAGALMDSEVTNLAQVKAFDSSDYATASQGTTANNALPKAGGAMTGAITTNSTFDGRDVATDGTKLDGIEAGATTDQTAAEIRALVESATDSNVFTDADHTKLNGIEASADVTDTANVTSAGALMDSEVDGDIKTLSLPANTTISAYGKTLVDDADASTARSTLGLGTAATTASSAYATAAQGTKADAALPKAGGTMSGNIDGNGNKVLFANVYSAEVDLPSASTYHGMFAHVHGTGKGYFAHAGAWVPLANETATLALSGGAMTGAITTNSTFDGRDVATDGTKLDGIASGATNTQVPAINSNGSVPGLASGITGAEVRSLIGAGTSSSDTTYSAGSGLGLSGTTFSHSDTSSQSSVNNSGATVIQDVTLDTYGHVTGLTSHTLTLGNLGYTGATNANYITNNNQLTNGAGYITSYVNTTYGAGAGLDLSGTTFSIESDLRDNIQYIGRDGNDYMHIGTTVFDWYINGGHEMRLESDGDLHVDGNVIAYSTTVSDERLKKDIVKIDNALDKVSQLNGYTFEYLGDGKKSAGVIAQEVEKVMPSAIVESTLPLKMGDDDKTEYKTVQYDQLHGLLIEAIKELKAEIEELKAR